MKRPLKNSKRGFTLVEMMVSLAIFMVVAVVAVGSLVRIVGLNRQAQSLQSSVNNISFSLDSMSREIRQGSNINCQRDYDGVSSFNPASISGECPDITYPNSLIVLETAKTAVDTGGQLCNLYYAYWFSPSGVPGQYFLKKAQQTSCGQQFTPSNFFSIIDDGNVKLTGYNLTLHDGSEFPYKWVFVRLTGFAGVRAQDQSYFDVETSISQRVAD
jgi:prepilin-type N-terminal cleavage/methylation domain-containing protein